MSSAEQAELWRAAAAAWRAAAHLCCTIRDNETMRAAEAAESRALEATEERGEAKMAVCRFCGASEPVAIGSDPKHKLFISGMGAMICENCVDVAAEGVAEHREKRRGNGSPETGKLPSERLGEIVGDGKAMCELAGVPRSDADFALHAVGIYLDERLGRG